MATEDTFINATTSIYSSDTMTPSINSSTNTCDPFNLALVLQDQRPIAMDISTYAPPTWWVIGIVGNVIALLVWLQPKMRHSSGYYLAALALSDLFFLIMNIIYEVNFTYDTGMLDRAVLCEWFVISYLTLQYISPVLVLAFTVERYLSVCHPFRTIRLNRLSNSKVTILVILGLALLCICINGVQGYFWTTEHEDRETVCDLRPEILLNGTWTYWTWCTEMLIFAAVPLTVLILNILVIVEVSNISKLERRNMRTNNIDRRSTTVMLLGVSFYQILTVLPVTTIYALYDQFKPQDSACLPADLDTNTEWQTFLEYHSVRIIIEKIGMSHYAANFFIYMLTGKIFRKQLYEMVVIFCCKNRLTYMTMNTIYTRTTRLSLTSHRGSIAKGRFVPKNAATDPCNNDTELGNKNSSLYSMAELETMDLSATNGHNHHSHRLSNAQTTRLLPCVEESDAVNYRSDKEESDTENGQT